MRLKIQDGLLDLGRGQIARDAVVNLSPLETRMLRYLAAAAPRAVSNDELLDAVWGYAAKVRSRAVRVSIGRLRAKLERDPSKPVHLVTARGEGYRLDAEPLRDPDLHPPEPLDPFIGRDDALAWIRARLETQRLITLEGPPGVGKTRLAVELGQRWPGPVGWFPLGNAADVERALGRIAARIGARTQDPTALGKQIANRVTLVVLDELDRIAAPFGDVIETWVRSSTLRVLATSRIPLGISGETRFEVKPLSAHSARALLADRSGLPEDDVADLAESCDGLPLALELTAGAARGVPVPAQQDPDPLLQAMKRSWILLDPGGQQALTDCTAFRGNFDLLAAEAVIGVGAASTLHRLRTLGLLHRTGGRMRVLTSLREAITTLGGEPAAARSRHLAHYQNIVTDLDCFGPKRSEALMRLLQERDELEAAIEEALRRGEPDTAAQLVTPYRYALRVRTGEHAIHWLTRVLEAADEDTEAILTVRTHYHESRLSAEPGGSTAELFAIYRRAKRLHMRAVVALCATGLGRALFLQGHHEEARTIFVENIDQNGPPRMMARIALGMAKVERFAGRPAMPWLQRALQWLHPPDGPPHLRPTRAH